MNDIDKKGLKEILMRKSTVGFDASGNEIICIKSDDFDDLADALLLKYAGVYDKVLVKIKGAYIEDSDDLLDSDGRYNEVYVLNDEYDRNVYE